MEAARTRLLEEHEATIGKVKGQADRELQERED